MYQTDQAKNLAADPPPSRIEALPTGGDSRHDRGMWRWIKEKDAKWATQARAYWARQFTRRRAIDWLVLSAATAFTVWLSYHTIPPGWSIGTLGTVALIMTFSRPSPLQRGCVIILAVSLLAIEMRSIYMDREAQRKAADASLQSILSDNQQRFAATEQGFSSVLSDDNHIKNTARNNLSATRKSLENITGGHSYAVLIPRVELAQYPVPIVMWNRGNNLLTGVHVVVYTVQIKQSHMTIVDEFDVGTITPQERRRIQPAYWLSPEILQDYMIEIYEQNGVFEETLQMIQNPKSKRFIYRYGVRKTTIEKRSGHETEMGSRPLEVREFDGKEFQKLRKDAEGVPAIPD